MKLRDMVRKSRPKHMVESIPVDDNYDKYPWGLRLNLGDQEIEKLGIDIKKMSVDDKVKITAIGYVESVRQSKNRTGEDQNIELQITKLEVKKTKTE